MASPRPGKPDNPKNPAGPKKQFTPPAPHGDPRKDDKVLRTMPITQTQLRQIKKQYGIN